MMAGENDIDGTDAAGRPGGVLATPAGLFLGALFCCVLWGSAFPCIKIGYRLFGVASADTASQMVFAGSRFLLAGVMVVVGMSVVRRRAVLPRRADLPQVAALATFQTILQYVCFYVGLATAAGVTSSIIEASNNFLAIVFAAFLFRSERLTGRKVLGCVVGFAGVVLVNLGGDGGYALTLGGEGMIFLSTCAGAMSTCLIQRFSRDHDPVMLSGWQFVVGGAALLLVGLAAGGRLEPTGAESWALLAYMGFISAGAYSVWSLLLQVNPVSSVSVFGFMNPVVGVVLSAALLAEGSVLDLGSAAVALALVSAGIVIVNCAPKSAKES